MSQIKHFLGPLWRKRHLPRIGGVCLAEGGRTLAPSARGLRPQAVGERTLRGSPFFVLYGKLSEPLPCYTGLNERGKTRCFRF